MQTVYKIVCRTNGKSFYSSTVLGDAEKILKKHEAYSKIPDYERKYPLYAEINRFGISSFEVVILHKFESKLDAAHKLKELIAEDDPAYNSIVGGNGAIYVDNAMVHRLFEKLGDAKAVSEEMNVPLETIKNHLKSKHFSFGEKTGKKRSVIKKSFDGQIVDVYDSLSSASIDMCSGGGARSNISRCCNGLRKQYGGFLWEYAD